MSPDDRWQRLPLRKVAFGIGETSTDLVKTVKSVSLIARGNQFDRKRWGCQAEIPKPVSWSKDRILVSVMSSSIWVSSFSLRGSSQSWECRWNLASVVETCVRRRTGARTGEGGGFQEKVQWRQYTIETLVSNLWAQARLHLLYYVLKSCAGGTQEGSVTNDSSKKGTGGGKERRVARVCKDT